MPAVLKKTMVAGMGWAVGVKIAFQIVTWAMTLVVIRLLSPSDYGLMAIAQVFTNFMLGFANLGLGDALLQRKETPPALVANTYGVILAISAALTVLLSVAAYPIAAWYGDPRLVALIQVSSLGFLFNAFTTLPRMALQKQMRMRPVFMADLTSGLAGAFVVIGLAYAGYGVWALMGGWLATNVVRQLAFLAVAREYYVWPQFDFAAVKPLMGFGAYSTLEYMAWIFMTSADVVIVGRLLGDAKLGLYAVVLNFAAMPVNKIAPIVNGLAFPAFAMVQGQLAEARFYVLKAIRLMSVLAVPVFLGIAVTSPEIVGLIFGPKWAAARPLLEILSVALIFRSLLILLPNFLGGIGDVKAAFWCTALGAAVFPVAILIGCHWGIAGACFAWLIAYPLVFAGEALIASRRAGLDFRAILAAPVRPLVAGGAMVLAVLAARQVLPADLPAALRLGVLAVVGAAAYGGFVAVIFPGLARVLGGVLPTERKKSFFEKKDQKTFIT